MSIAFLLLIIIKSGCGVLWDCEHLRYADSSRGDGYLRDACKGHSFISKQCCRKCYVAINAKKCSIGKSPPQERTLPSI